MALAPDRAWRGAVVLIAALGGANLSAWGAAGLEAPDAAVAMLALLGAAAGTAAGSRWRGGEAGLLVWDGTAWHWREETGAPGIEVRAMLDLGGWILLRLRCPQQRPRTLWAVASRRQAQGAWALWRTALTARPAAQAPGGGLAR